MVFSSITFLYYFLPLVLLSYFALHKKCGNGVLFIFSLLFYAWGEPVYVFLMLFSTVFNYFAGLKIEKGTKKKTILVVSVVVNFLILLYFKYFGFIISIINSIFGLKIAVKELALPVGISFYTFQAVSYLIDVYRNDAKAQKNFVNFACYITLFPQLIAGPIVRYNQIEEQLDFRRETTLKFGSGVSRFVAGLCKKVLIANNIGALWNSVSTLPLNELSTLNAWIGIVAFTLQIYFDFSGYSDMAIGLGKMLGFTFDENFNYPYISKSVSEFWRRWHISLGTWFKEYVYIPLGGSRVKKARMFFNLFIVWMLTGLWHGASYNFVLWGLYYAVLLIIEKTFLLKLLKKCPAIVEHIYTMLMVIFGWVLFASENLAYALSYFKTMFGFSQAGLCDSRFFYSLSSYVLVLVLAIAGCLPYPKRLFESAKKNRRFKIAVPYILALGFVICTAYLVDSTFNPFLYFRF